MDLEAVKNGAGIIGTIVSVGCMVLLAVVFVRLGRKASDHFDREKRRAELDDRDDEAWRDA